MTLEKVIETFCFQLVRRMEAKGEEPTELADELVQTRFFKAKAGELRVKKRKKVIANILYFI